MAGRACQPLQRATGGHLVRVNPRQADRHDLSGAAWYEVSPTLSSQTSDRELRFVGLRRRVFLCWHTLCLM